MYAWKSNFQIYNRFQKIPWNSTFYSNHARKMEKSYRQNRIYPSICTLFIYESLSRLHAYGFSKNALNLMSSYLTNRKQGVQNNSIFSAAKTIISGILQRSIGGPLLFKSFINDPALYLTETMLSNYDDDSNLFSIGKDINEVKDTLAKDFRIVTN